MSKDNIDYRAIVERIAEILHGGVTDVDLLTVTVQAMKQRLALRERAEPVAYMIGGHYLMHAHDPKVDNYSSAVPLYTAPPAPVMPDPIPETEIEDGNDIDYMEPSAIYELGKNTRLERLPRRHT